MLLLFWVAFTGLFAYGQGLIFPAIRRTSPGSEAKKQAFALHWVFGAVWLAPVLFTFTWQAVVLASLIRFVVFDPVLNLAEGNHPFAVGNTADTDKLLRKLATVSGVPVSLLSAGLRGSVLLLLIWGILIQLI